MVAFSTSNTFTELLPNAGIKEIVVVTPTKTIAADTITVTLAEHGISATGLLTVRGQLVSATYGIVTDEPTASTTAVSSGVLTITVGAAAAEGSRIFRITGRSS